MKAAAVEFPVDRDFVPSECDAEEFTNVAGREPT